ncbi:hypothetical protein KIW84_066593 [Lathyrus oleraceus]|uniref:beta-aspartyl-peptidase n=1 Tax=Pisum sativum TaxID=3888 RepID=A0A9D5ABE4_PEA|nr:hypothetical protein KIW84_066593 [Pisum sativum]
MWKRFKDCVVLIQHSTTVLRTKRKRAHRAYAQVVCKVVVVDSNGNLAPATSTGGLVNKMAGRIGDTPVIGAGTYADEFCAVSATGICEAIIRGTVARDMAAIMEFKGLSLKEAADCVIHECTPKGAVGLVYNVFVGIGEGTVTGIAAGFVGEIVTGFHDGYWVIGLMDLGAAMPTRIGG